MKYKLIASLLIVHCSLLIINAQNLLQSEYAYRHFTTRDGLPTNMVENLFQDSHGFLWFATEHGISRFDGKNFKTFMANKSLPINKIEENERGEIVIYGYYFINILNTETGEIRRTFTDRNLNYLVHYSPCLPRGYSFFTKRDAGKNAIFHLEADTLREIFYHPLFDKMCEGQSVFYDLQNSLVYIPTEENDLYIVDFHKNIKKKYKNIECCRFIKNGDEILAVGLENVYSVSIEKITHKIRFPHKIRGDVDVILDKDDNLILRDDKSVFRYSNGKFETIIDNINIARNFMFDSEGNFWLVSRSGIFNFFHLDVRIFTINDSGDLVYQIVPVGNSSGYFATGNGNLIYFENDIFTKIAYPQKANGTSFSQCWFKFGNAIYFTTYQDILKLQNGKFSWLNLPPDIYHVAACSLGADKWLVGGWNTFWILDKNDKILGKMSQRELNRNTFYSVAADKNENIWIGGHNGICRINKHDTLYFFNDGTMNAESVDMDSEGKVWFACEGNIYVCQDSAIKQFMSFKDEVLYNLRIVDNLVVTSASNKVIIIDTATKQTTIYDYSNGLSDCEPGWATMAKDLQGNIYIGTQSPSVLYFNPKTLFNRMVKPNLFIEKIEKSKNNVEWLPVSNYEKLNHKDNNLKISYTGLCFSNPDAVRYRYRLIGFQNEFSEPTTQCEVRFNNLPHRNYTFEVFADAGTDNSKSEIKTFNFTIHPAFWQTKWFLIIAILSLASLSSLISLLFIQRKNRRILQKLETEKQLNELKINTIRLKAIPHFNANVLAVIEYYIMNKSNGEAINVLGIYSQFTLQTLREVDRASRSLSIEIDYVKMYLDLEKLRFGEKFEYEILIDENVNQSIQLPNMILHTWAENAVKHGFAGKASGGKIVISAQQNGDFITVSVTDNGAGRQAAAINKNIRSTKQGLSILERQVEIYNRFNKRKIKLLVEDLTEGTRFAIEVPENYQYEIQ